MSGLVAVLIHLLSTNELIGVSLTFISLTILLTIYLVLEINRVRRLHPYRWLINPVVLCSIMTFFLAFGVSNIIYFLPQDMIKFFNYIPEVTPAMNKLMLLAVIGALAMWLGYWSPIAGRLSILGLMVRFRDRIFSFDSKPKAWVLPALVLISFISRLVAIQNGLYGYSSTVEKLIAAASYTQYLSLAGSLGKLALVISTLQYYSPQRNLRGKVWFLGIFIGEVAFGFMGGFKSAVIMPFIIVFLGKYIRTGRVSRNLLIVIPIMLIIAYAVIEPFRSIKNLADKYQGGYQSTSVLNIGSTVFQAIKFAYSGADTREKSSFIVGIMARSNLTSNGSKGIEFADYHKSLPVGSPEFLNGIIFAPIYAWVPRFLWEGKPIWDIGLWYTNTVLGYDNESSTAMGIFTYLYFAGGVIAVFGSLFCIGVVHRVFFFFTRPWLSTAGATVFLSMLPSISMIAEGAFNGVIVSLFRELPLIVIITAVMFARIKFTIR
jgi:hypothetical protein